jgi:hypothetical protein
MRNASTAVTDGVQVKEGRTNGIRTKHERYIRSAHIIFTGQTEGMGGWKKLHNGELCNLYCSPCIIRIIKSRKMRWQGM